MFLLRPRRKKEFALRGRRGRDGVEQGKRFEFRHPRRRPLSRFTGYLWLIVLLIVVIFMMRYLRMLNW